MKHLFYVCKVLNKDETGSFCYGKISFNDCVFLKLDLMYEGGWWQVCSFVARVCCLRGTIPLFGWFRLFNSIHVISILPMFTSLSTLGFADYRRKTGPINFRKIFVKPKSKLLGRFAKKRKFKNMSKLHLCSNVFLNLKNSVITITFTQALHAPTLTPESKTERMCK